MSTQVTQALQQLLTDGAVLGAVSWAVLAGLIWFWTDFLHNQEPSNDAKRIMAVVVPVVLVLIGYFFGVARGYFAYSDDGLYAALKLAVGLGIAKALFTGTKAVQKALGRPSTPDEDVHAQDTFKPGNQ